MHGRITVLTSSWTTLSSKKFLLVLRPQALQSDCTGATTATLTYIPSAGNTGYTIEWGPCGYTPGTGTMPSTTTTNDTVTITGLSPNTCYDFYVFANCGSSTGTSPVGQPARRRPCVKRRAFLTAMTSRTGALRHHCLVGISTMALRP